MDVNYPRETRAHVNTIFGTTAVESALFFLIFILVFALFAKTYLTVHCVRAVSDALPPKKCTRNESAVRPVYYDIVSHLSLAVRYTIIYTRQHNAYGNQYTTIIMVSPFRDILPSR